MKEDFILSEKEKNNIVSYYSSLIDFNEMDFNLRFLNRYAYFDFIQFDYDNESSMDKYIYETIKDSEYIYAIPLVFSNDDFRTILHDYSPSVIAKLVSNINNYNRIFGSHVADYTGSFLVFSEDFSYFCIINNGHYICRFHNVRDIYIKNSCEYINIEMYDYDKNFLSKLHNKHIKGGQNK